jgi:hypothetical protein
MRPCAEGAQYIFPIRKRPQAVYVGSIPIGTSKQPVSFEVYDLSTMDVRSRRRALFLAENLCVNRRHLRFVLASRAVFTVLAKYLPFIRSIQRSVYEHCYTRLNNMQLAINPCGWGEVGTSSKGKPRCRRYWRQCCEFDYTCEYLDDGGCPVRSLCCKMWLCAEATTWLNKTAGDTTNPLSRNCRRYRALRQRYDLLLRALAVPLRGRCSVEDTFNGEVDWEMNTDVDGWYEGIVIRDRWVFPTMEEAEKEKQTQKPIYL